MKQTLKSTVGKRPNTRSSKPKHKKCETKKVEIDPEELDMRKYLDFWLA